MALEVQQLGFTPFAVVSGRVIVRLAGVDLPLPSRLRLGSAHIGFRLCMASCIASPMRLPGRRIQVRADVALPRRACSPRLLSYELIIFTSPLLACLCSSVVSSSFGRVSSPSSACCRVLLALRSLGLLALSGPPLTLSAPVKILRALRRIGRRELFKRMPSWHRQELSAWYAKGAGTRASSLAKAFGKFFSTSHPSGGGEAARWRGGGEDCLRQHDLLAHACTLKFTASGVVRAVAHRQSKLERAMYR